MKLIYVTARLYNAGEKLDEDEVASLEDRIIEELSSSTLPLEADPPLLEEIPQKPEKVPTGPPVEFSSIEDANAAYVVLRPFIALSPCSLGIGSFEITAIDYISEGVGDRDTWYDEVAGFPEAATAIAREIRDHDPDHRPEVDLIGFLMEVRVANIGSEDGLEIEAGGLIRSAALKDGVLQSLLRPTRSRKPFPEPTENR